MNPDFEMGRRYQLQEVMHMLHAIRMIDDDYKMRQMMAAWEQEIAENLIIRIEETYVVFK